MLLPERLLRAVRALDSWQAAGCDERCSRFQNEHPWEQGCLQELLKADSALAGEIRVAPGHMNLWNGPWGVFVRHVWGGPGKENRNWAFDDMTTSLGLDVREMATRVKEAAEALPALALRSGCQAAAV